jgi:ketosteroid isomerase-like protein
MDKAKVEKEIMDLERKYWRALQENDVETAIALTDFPCIVAGPQGVQRFEREAFEEMMSNAPYQIRRVDIGDHPLVRMVSDDCVVVAYKVHEEATVDGEATSLDATDTSAWVQRDGQWRCALHSESIAGDAWGRDKKPQPEQARP